MRRIMSDKGPVEFAVFDGYSFGDRLLEGVMFKAWIDENDEIQVEPVPGNEGYLSDLNMGKWLKEAKTFAEEADRLSDYGGNIYWIEEVKPKKKAKVVKKKKASKHQLKSMKDLLQGR